MIFITMAFWSHTKASPPNDPGYLKWEHFRTPAQLNDLENKKNWADPFYRKKMAAKKEALQEVDDFDSPGNKLECQKCGCIKVKGVHHCSSCGVCTLAMDHHCPWTNNCVGYLTLKPFLLFLLNVTLLCFWMAGMCYNVAWKREL